MSLQAQDLSSNLSFSMMTKEEFELMSSLCKMAVDSKYFKDTIGGFAGAFCIALYAKEMGLPLMQCLFGGVRSVKGRVEISPQMMNAMIRNRGHILKTIEHTESKCTIHGKRIDTGEDMPVSFTIDDAKKAGIYQEAWLKYPKNMVYKSALSNLARWLFPDVIGMAYVEGEIEGSDINKKTGEISLAEAEISLPVQEKDTENQRIEKDIVIYIEKMLIEFVDPVDESYRKSFLNHYKIESIDQLPAKKQKAAISSINKKIADIRKKELEKDADLQMAE